MAKWKSQSGWIDIEDMTDEHLENSLNYCDKQIKLFRRLRKNLIEEKARRTDHPVHRLKSFMSKLGIGI